MTRPDDLKDCTPHCERMPFCRVCYRRKKPWGRAASLSSSYCDQECEGYNEEPTPGHLWPGELKDLDNKETR